MSKPSLILIGAGGHARSCIDVVEMQDIFSIVGLVGTAAELHTSNLGYAVIGTDEDLPQLATRYQNVLIVVGQVESPDIRIRLHQHVIQLQFRLPVVVAPTAHVSRHAAIGAGTIVMHGAIVNAGARIGENCIINSRSLVEHDAVIEDHCHIATGAILNGGARVGMGSFVGSGAVIREGISLGARCVVGMGLSVRRDCANGARVTAV